MKRFTGAVIGAILAVHSSLAFPQAGEIAAGAAVSDVVAQLESSIKSIIGELDATFSKQQFELRTNLLITLQQLKVTSEGLIGKTFSQLNETEQKAFVDAKRLVDEWNRGNKDIAKQLNSVAATLEEAVSRVPLSSRVPYVKSAQPAYLLSGSKETSILFTVSGSLVAEGDPTLSFGGINCDRIGKDTRSLSFSCPTKPFVASSSVTYKTGALTVFKPRTWWQQVTGFFTGTEATAVPYQIAVAVIPEVMGTLSGTVTAITLAPEENTRVAVFSHTNDHCQRETHHVWTVNATAGWAIVPSSVVNQSAGRSNCNANVIGISESGFQLDGYVRNNGVCGPRLPFGGPHVPVDARGQLTARAGYKETRTVEKKLEVQIEPVTLIWGVEKLISIPEKATALNLTLVKLTGGQDVLTQSDVRPWYDIQVDLPNKRVIVRPKPLSVALGG